MITFIPEKYRYTKVEITLLIFEKIGLSHISLNEKKDFFNGTVYK